MQEKTKTVEKNFSIRYFELSREVQSSKIGRREVLCLEGWLFLCSLGNTSPSGKVTPESVLSFSHIRDEMRLTKSVCVPVLSKGSSHIL